MEPINVTDLITTDVAEQSAAAAFELIKQSGWSIVAELASAVAQGLNATSLVVYPISVKLDEYKALLTDPEGFEAKYNTLRKDVLKMSAVMVDLYKMHEGKTGAPAGAEELTLCNGLTLGYSKLQGTLESAIHPLMLNLVAELEAVGVTDLTLEESHDE